eukprot:TRINITY_DN6611_c0_g1_i1.p1 TRINITY_DN6611_c0_g1~~TRINITY_DN6611_c0_g1_i1.p1  ORF type:complete len:1288 (+),score=389.41 TRINITY_DN6611_c0_g1_i1:108-3971(+)
MSDPDEGGGAGALLSPTRADAGAGSPAQPPSPTPARAPAAAHTAGGSSAARSRRRCDSSSSSSSSSCAPPKGRKSALKPSPKRRSTAVGSSSTASVPRGPSSWLGGSAPRSSRGFLDADSDSDAEAPPPPQPQPKPARRRADTAAADSPGAGWASAHPLMFAEESVTVPQQQRANRLPPPPLSTGRRTPPPAARGGALGTPGAEPRRPSAAAGSAPGSGISPPPSALPGSAGSSPQGGVPSLTLTAAEPAGGALEHGTLELHGGERYEGQMQAGRAHGVGESVVQGVCQYRGHWEHGVRQGEGSLLVFAPARWALHCSWSKDRIENGCLALVEHASGDRYFGYISASAPQAAGDSFAAYVRSVTVLRNGIGELCSASKDRYYGSWVSGRRTWFGVQIYADGSKYYGLWDADTRDRRGTQLRTDGAVYEGAWRRDEPNGHGVLLLPSGFSVRGQWKGDALSARAQCSPAAHEASMWSRTRAAATLGLGLSSVQRPKQERVGGRWRDFTHHMEDDLQDERRRLEHPQSAFMQPLIAALQRPAGEPPTLELVAALTEQEAAGLRPDYEKLLVSYIKSSFGRPRKVLGSIAAWFHRYFVFMYGSCRGSDEIGGGPSTGDMAGGYLDQGHFLKAQGGRRHDWAQSWNKHLSYCANKNHFGGCIHQGPGTKIDASHLHNACEDLTAFLYKLHSCSWHAFGAPLTELLQQRMELGPVLFRTVNDLVMQSISPVLRNLYRATHRKEDQALALKLLSLQGVTLDDLGVNFARDRDGEALFQPYDAAIRALHDLEKRTCVASKLLCLRTVAQEIDRQAMLNQLKVRSGETRAASPTPQKQPSNPPSEPAAYSEVMAAHRRRAGSHAPVEVTYAGDAPDIPADGGSPPQDLSPVAGAAAAPEGRGRMGSAASALDGADAARRTQQSLSIMGGEKSLLHLGAGDAESSALFTPRPAGVPTPRVSAAASVYASAILDDANTSAEDVFRVVQGIEGGSADDLFPINLYVFIKCGHPNFASELQFLLDWTSNSELFDCSSDDAYRLATLQACLSYVQELDWNVRDRQRVLIPFSVLEQRLVSQANDAVGRMRAAGVAQYRPHDRCFLDKLPQLAWVRDVLLRLAAASIDDYEWCGRSRVLRLPRDLFLPRGCCGLFATLLEPVGLSLVFGAAALSLPELRRALCIPDAAQQSEVLAGTRPVPDEDEPAGAGAGAHPPRQYSSSDSEDPLSWTKIKPREWKSADPRLRRSIMRTPSRSVTFAGGAGSETLDVPASVPLALRFDQWYPNGVYSRLSEVFSTCYD